MLLNLLARESLEYGECFFMDLESTLADGPICAMLQVVYFVLFCVVTSVHDKAGLAPSLSQQGKEAKTLFHISVVQVQVLVHDHQITCRRDSRNSRVYEVLIRSFSVDAYIVNGCAFECFLELESCYFQNRGHVVDD